MLDVITDLAPRFYVAYAVGAQTLSILVGDKLGARDIYEKGILNYPFDWRLYYRAGYHYLYEIGDEAKAADRFYMAARHEAPAWVAALSAKLFTKEGKAELAYRNVVEFLATYNKKDMRPDHVERVRLRLGELEKELKKAGRLEEVRQQLRQEGFEI